MSTCTCPHIDGFRIRRKGCLRHNECLDQTRIASSGVILVCTKPLGHDMPHEAPDGTWWEPPTPEAVSLAWPFGAEAAARLVAATSWPNEAPENRDAWAVRLVTDRELLNDEARHARDRLSAAIDYLRHSPTDDARRESARAGMSDEENER